MSGSRSSRVLVDIKAELRYQTDAAYLLVVNGRKVWVPKSQVEDNGDGTFTMPDWLAAEKEIDRDAE